MADTLYEEITIQVNSDNADATLKALTEGFQALQSLAENIGKAITRAVAPLQRSLKNTEESIGVLTHALDGVTVAMQEMGKTDFLEIFGVSVDTIALVVDLIVHIKEVGAVLGVVGSAVWEILKIVLNGITAVPIKLINGLSVAVSWISSVFLPAISSALSTFSGWITNTLGPAVSSAFTAAGGWITGTLVPTISAALSSIGAALSAVAGALGIGVGWLVAIVAAVIAAIVAIVVYWDEIKLFFTDTLPKLWSRFTSWFSAKLQQGIAFVQSIFTSITTFLQGAFARDWTQQFGAFGNVLNAFFANVENIWNAIKDIFSGIVSFVKNVFAGDWGAAWNSIVSVFEGIWDYMLAVVKTPINGHELARRRWRRQVQAQCVPRSVDEEGALSPTRAPSIANGSRVRYGM